jgi:CheY-like chemotaxis protein
MLGVTSYQEALRALGSLLDDQREQDGTPELVLTETPEQALLTVCFEGSERRVSAARLEQIVLASRARRGTTGARPGQLSDLLRSIGFALDEVDAVALELDLRATTLRLRFRGRDPHTSELLYAGDELEALRGAAVARRNGAPLSRVLLLHDDAQAAAPLRALLVAEFAVQALPSTYAPAVAEAGEPPDAILAVVVGRGAPALEGIRTLRASSRTASVPIVLVASATVALDPSEAFAAGVDDILLQPLMPAQLRARLRTWLLRRHSVSAS